MKRQALVRELTEARRALHRHGKRHDLFRNPVNGRQAPVPRHREIADSLCALIRRRVGLDEKNGGPSSGADGPF